MGDKVPVSDLCDHYIVQPTVFYRWLREFFENGAAAFQKTKRKGKDSKDIRIERLEKKLQAKNEVLSELMEERIKVKKSWGVLSGLCVPHGTRDAVVNFIKYRLE